jgi:hypothetical protein
VLFLLALLGPPIAFLALATVGRTRLGASAGFLGVVVTLAVFGLSASAVFGPNSYYEPARVTNWESHPGGRPVVVVAFAGEIGLAVVFAVLAIRKTQPPAVRRLCVISALAAPALMVVSILAVAGN